MTDFVQELQARTAAALDVRHHLWAAWSAGGSPPPMPCCPRGHGEAADFGQYREACLELPRTAPDFGVTADTAVSWELPTWNDRSSRRRPGPAVGLPDPLNPILPAARGGLHHGPDRRRAPIVPPVTEDSTSRRWRGGRPAGTDSSVLVSDRTLPEGDPPTCPDARPRRPPWPRRRCGGRDGRRSGRAVGAVQRGRHRWVSSTPSTCPSRCGRRSSRHLTGRS